MHRPVLAALLLAPVVALTACAGSDDAVGTAPSPATAPSSAPPSPSAPAAEPEPVVTPDDAQAVNLTFAAGEVTGDIGRVDVPLGTRVRLTVTSDVVDQIHVHGFDLYEDLSPGQSSQVEFLADRPGIFEIELHDARRVLTRLQIS
jgi:hypothetical protein